MATTNKRNRISPMGNFFIFPAVLVLLFWFACEKKSKPSAPNIILILCDTLRADHLSCCGYYRKTSPFIDSLIERGLFFEACYAAASRTGPSISSLFTSLYPGFHGAVNSLEGEDMKAILGEGNRTMAEILRDNGFYTYAIFSNVNASPLFGYAQGFEKYTFTNNPTARHVRLEAVKVLKKLTKKKPFFLYIHFMDPHSPYTPPEPFNNYFDPQYQGNVTGGSHKQLDRIMMQKEKVSSRDIEHLAAQYDGEIRYFDNELRILFNNIESFGMLKDSIIIFTADHGEEFFEHGKLLHGYTLYQEQLWVPLIIMGKNIPIRKISQPVSLIDLLPTLLNLSGIKEKTQFQGRNILIKQKSMNFYLLYAEASLNAVFTIKYKSVIKNGWKYIYDVLDNSEELYNLGEDPEEKINLVSKNPPQLAQLRKQMKKFIRATAKSSGQTITPIDEKTREQLKTLGYIK